MLLCRCRIRAFVAEMANLPTHATVFQNATVRNLNILRDVSSVWAISAPVAELPTLEACFLGFVLRSCVTCGVRLARVIEIYPDIGSCIRIVVWDISFHSSASRKV